MLSDRDYIRDEPAYRRGWSGWTLTTWLVIANVAAFVLQNLAYLAFGHLRVDAYFALSLPGLKHFFFWQLLTFQFMHGGLWHIAINCFVIWMFGREVEVSLGKRSFLTLYFSSGVIGGLFQVLGALVLPARFGGEVVGASAGAFGLVAAYATLYPTRQLTLLLFFILPINLQARLLLVIEGLITLYGLLFGHDGVAHGAHLGGMLTGIAFALWVGEWHWPRLRQPFPRRTPRVLVATRTKRKSPWKPAKTQAVDDLPADEFISQEVDPILDKISQHGIHSLTEPERRILEAARQKMTGR